MHTHVLVAGIHLLADPAGALLVEDERLLVVADLHLEKGSSLARRGMMLPPYDTAATLGRLAVLIERYAPRRVVALGDSFHDPRAAERLASTDRETLRRLMGGRDWLWITGNHDPHAPAGLPGEVAADWRHGPLHFRHEPRAGARYGEIAGHLHPVALVAGRSGTTRRRSFVSDGSRCVMPAFGAYAGGLNLHDAAFAALFGVGSRTAHALGAHRVYAIPERHCLPDAPVMRQAVPRPPLNARPLPRGSAGEGVGDVPQHVDGLFGRRGGRQEVVGQLAETASARLPRQFVGQVAHQAGAGEAVDPICRLNGIQGPHLAEQQVLLARLALDRAAMRDDRNHRAVGPQHVGQEIVGLPRPTEDREAGPQRPRSPRASSRTANWLRPPPPAAGRASAGGCHL